MKRTDREERFQRNLKSSLEPQQFTLTSTLPSSLSPVLCLSFTKRLVLIFLLSPLLSTPVCTSLHRAFVLTRSRRALPFFVLSLIRRRVYRVRMYMPLYITVRISDLLFLVLVTLEQTRNKTVHAVITLSLSH